MTRRAVHLAGGARTPFLKARGAPGPFTPVDLAVQCGRPLLLRLGLAPDAFDRVILGCVNVVAHETNPARVAALRLGLSPDTVAYGVQINCGSGMQSIDLGWRMIRDGDADLVLAGGAEALSHAPLTMSEDAVRWYAKFAGAKGALDTARTLGELRPGRLKPVVGLAQGLTDPITDLNMGQTAEVLSHRFDVSREAADRYARRSHLRLARAQAEGWLDDEIESAFDRDGEGYVRDDGVRPDTTLERLAALPPAFEAPYGKVSAGNASQITDGACWTVLASDAGLARHGLASLARIVDAEWSALDPSIMGLAPVTCSTRLLCRQGLGCGDVGVWELNEAFAAQVLACLAAWADERFCREVLGLDAVFGAIEPDRLNPDGGAIALGHPVAASGNRIVLHLAHAMRRLGARRGVATECIGGGQGGAMLLEREARA
ncbi:MAG: acetyl-CoA C-acetyltransferase [Lautropia sp.]